MIKILLMNMMAAMVLISAIDSVPALDNKIETNRQHVEETIKPTEEPVVEETIKPTEEPVVEETIKPTEEPETLMSDEDIDLISIVTMAEAEGESELGKRLVISTILNRIDHNDYPDTAYGVIYQPGQFSSMWNGRSDRCYVQEDIKALVESELKSRTNNDVIYFRMDYYSEYGTAMFQEGCHYFSSY